MLELYDSKFIITTDTGKLINCYSQYDDAKTDAVDVVEKQNVDEVVIYEQIEMLMLGTEYLQKTYRVRERLTKGSLSKEAETGVEEKGTE